MPVRRNTLIKTFLFRYENVLEIVFINFRRRYIETFSIVYANIQNIYTFRKFDGLEIVSVKTFLILVLYRVLKLYTYV